MKNTFLNEAETKRALADFILKTDKLSMGEKCREFEKAFAAKQGRKDAILFNSGGSANLALFQALKNLGWIEAGDQVGFSALTWSTNVMPIIQMGMEPIAVDCSPKTLNLMAENLEERLKDTRLKCLFITNALGFAGDLDKIEALCREKGIILLEDNCEALGSEVNGKKCGNFSLAATFSFFVAHHMSTIEGGLIVTDNEELAEMLKIVRANGWDRNLSAASQVKWRKNHAVENEFEAKYAFYDLGFNLRPTEITGFLGLTQLEYLEDNIKKREANFLELEKNLKLNDDFMVLNHDHLTILSSFAFPVVCKSPELRNKYLAQFSGAGIEIRPMIAGNIQKQPFYQKYVKNCVELPGTDYIHECGFYCGNYPELTESDLETIKSCLIKY